MLGVAISRVSEALPKEPSLATSTAYFICSKFKKSPPFSNYGVVSQFPKNTRTHFLQKTIPKNK
jgi:hypothetical protein